MRTVFVDTGYWIASLHSKDELHQRVRAIAAELGEIQLVTSEMVLTELLNDFSKRNIYLKRMAVNLVSQVRKDRRVEVVSQTPELYEQSFQLYQKRLDQAWSQTDCASFILMQERGITEALAYDKHFKQAGFKALLR